MAQIETPNAAEMAAYKWVMDNPPALDPVKGDDGYPSDIEVQRIRHWFDEPGSITFDGLAEVMAYVRERWNYDAWEEIVDKDGNVFYQISTYGWSGNETLWSALESTWVYWLMFVSHRRGGHYVLELKASMKESDGTTQSPDA